MGSEGAFLRLACAAAILTGCGKVDNDAPADAGPDADLGGDATVVTQAALFGSPVGAKVGNIDLVSSFPDGKVLATGKTDDAGSATIRVYPGGSVTAAYKHTGDAGYDLITWAAVKPGDTLTFGARQLSSAGTTNTNLGAQTYTFPMTFPGAATVYVVTSCSGASAPIANGSVAVTEYALCHQEPMDVVFYALDASNKVVGVGSRQNVGFTSGGSVALGGFTAAQTGTINITGLPTEVGTVSGHFYSVVDGRNEIGYGGNYSGTPTGGAFTATFPWSPTGERTVGTLGLYRNGFSAMNILDGFSTNTTNQTVAMPSAVPWMQGFTSVSLALRRATWFAVPNASATVDGQLVTVSWYRTVDSKSFLSQWTAILPAGPSSFDLPELPAALSEANPAAADYVNSGYVREFDISTISDYDALRAQPAGNLSCLECTVRSGEYQRVIYTSTYLPNIF